MIILDVHYKKYQLDLWFENEILSIINLPEYYIYKYSFYPTSQIKQHLLSKDFIENRLISLNDFQVKHSYYSKDGDMIYYYIGCANCHIFFRTILHHHTITYHTRALTIYEKIKQITT